MFDAAADLLPDDPVVWLVTPSRFVLAAGLIAGVIGLWP